MSIHAKISLLVPAYLCSILSSIAYCFVKFWLGLKCFCKLARWISTLKYRLFRRDFFSQTSVSVLRTYDLSLVFTIGFLYSIAKGDFIIHTFCKAVQ